jgi:CheY-like chemotaxis protein
MRLNQPMSSKVLVADDDPGMLELVAEALERPGVTVLRAENGGELLERLADEGPFDLIVTDVSMPWMSGLQVANSARTAGVRTPVVVITATKDPTLDQQVAALGSNARLLRKPFVLDDLEAAVGSLLKLG